MRISLQKKKLYKHQREDYVFDMYTTLPTNTNTMLERTDGTGKFDMHT
jgi:hypothetical protein